ncbi:pyridoxamine/pyridoxine/pyridoxal transmembrane transporter [Schizosaccharomyces osmophilus]|uniref:Pyridoxamine/pyridoxine/pyridoxal transmembrane transporter n=1 Tax=Schizosaccharomyces osmophilus TaxID=2545709 RepID=A0AAF0AWS9_9SCHI|nr:pyridoxamine/pyridoxine/pyridoxal transmembrane transporter [Schizosaccharomyces osmophilus]WBW75076.1 pyridoxamine/pyridoxine/pyridoxal transmembrane transporter [Schizosaccharomyces osmophilus]
MSSEGSSDILKKDGSIRESEDSVSIPSVIRPSIAKSDNIDSYDYQESSDYALRLEEITTNHPAHPQNWTTWKKAWLIVLTTSLQAYVFWTPNFYSGVSSEVSEEWNLSSQTSLLGQSMFLLGVALGPLVLGPLSDLVGRKFVYIGSLLVYICFNVSCALAINYPQLVISMFILGAVGSTTLANVAGGVADLLRSEHSNWGMYMFIFMCSVSSIGSPMGTAVSENPKLGWRWLYWINVIVGGFFLLVLAFSPETLPVIVVERHEARQNNKPVSMFPRLTFKTLIKNTYFILSVALKIFFTEPIVTSLGIYNGFVNGLLYFFLQAIWPVYVDIYKMSDMAASSTYLAAIPACIILLWLEPLQSWLYRRDKRINKKSRPEARFKMTIALVWGFPVGIFMFAFCTKPSIHYIVSLIALTIFNMADYHIWQAMLLYITDSYPSVSASAVAAFELPSNLGSTAFVHLSALMFSRMNIHWATAVIGFVSLPLIALIYVLYFFGHRIRSRSKLATRHFIQLDS